MSWMKTLEPRKGPAAPPKMDLARLHTMALGVSELGALPPEIATLLKMAPAQKVDRWGMPLPLSEAEQNRLDRVAAILARPLVRGRALLVAGQLAPDEVQALVDGRNAAYTVLVQQATRELLEAGPPIAPWSEAQLAILFGRPVAQVFGGQGKTQESSTHASGGGGNVVPFGTPAERREVAVREGNPR